MASIELQTGHRVSILQIIAKPFVALENALIAIAEANPRYRHLEALSNMTDEELAAKGLKREDIVRHVFPEKFAI